MDWSWAIEGITEDVPRSTGPECVGYLSTRRKILETIFVTSLCLWAIKWAIPRLQPINLSYNNYQQLQQSHYPLETETQQLGKKILLVLMTFIFGMEIGFKFATKTVIFALNPCHITTIIQIYLLAAKPSKTTTALFRIQMNYLNGPLLAFLFPEADSRLLPLEATAYWIQHGLMFIIPIYLLRLGGAYQMEHILDFKWNIISYALCNIYHFTFLQFMSMISNVNLNHMLCSALSDPFDGQNYRLFAVTHQAILCPFLCKLFCILFTKTNRIQLDVKIIKNNSETLYKEYIDNQNSSGVGGPPTITGSSSFTSSSASSGLLGAGSGGASRIEDHQIMTTKID